MSILTPPTLPPSLAMRMQAACDAARPARSGRVSRVVGLNIEVSGLEAAVGDEVLIDTPAGELEAEVVALSGGGLVCVPYGDVRGVRAGARAVSSDRQPTIAVGAGLLGRILDGLGNPIDGLGPIDASELVTLDGTPPHPLRRPMVEEPLTLGVRALDSLIPCGRGQRMGIMAGSGVGKSSLLSMIVRGTAAPISVLALIGERGREVREFIERDLGPEGLARSVVIVATSDEPPLVRIRAAWAATRIAEWFRDAGNDVMLLMDSLTRFAMAQREVGLAAGEPPTTRGYPPSVFSLLPKLLERAGASEHGSITALYTVLVEGDDMNEPIGDAARSILDGHIVLSRRLASAGHFPTIDVLESVSRVSGAVTTPGQAAAAVEFRRLLAAYRDAKDLIEIGAYSAGTNPEVDRAVALRPAMDAFLRQGIHEPAPINDTWAAISGIVSGGFIGVDA